MKTFAIANGKGGVGKSTSATTIAHLLAAEHGQRVLLADIDPQSNTTSLFAPNKPDVLQIIRDVFLSGDFTTLQPFEHNIGELLVNPKADIHQCIYHTDYPGLDLLPADLSLSEIEEKMKADIRVPQQFRLQEHFNAIQDDYDYCILDFSPSINIININGLVCSDYVLVPLRCDMWGIAGFCLIKNLIETVSRYHPSLKLGGCFFTQFNVQTSISKQVRDLMASVMGEQYIDIPIRKSVKAEEMTYERRALSDYASKEKITEDYRAFVDYIIAHF